MTRFLEPPAVGLSDDNDEDEDDDDDDKEMMLVEEGELKLSLLFMLCL